MKLIVYKGFDENFLKNINYKPLVEGAINEKINVLKFDKERRKKLAIELLSLEEDEEVWVTYEEYSLIKSTAENAVREDDLKIIMYKNNLYPDYYPINFEMSDKTVNEIFEHMNSSIKNKISDNARRFLAVYNSLVKVDGKYYGSFYNFEYEKKEKINVKNFYPANIKIEEYFGEADTVLFINEDVDTYLRDLARIKKVTPKIIGVTYTKGLVAKRLIDSLKTFCTKENIRLVNYYEEIIRNDDLENELVQIAKNDIKIQGFEKFRTIQFYKNPDINKEVVNVSQSTIIQEIIHQAENSYDDKNQNSFRDIFITASTGAGKSVMFQIPAVYLAKKYKKLTIIIEPVKALMQDQKDKLISNGYTRVEAFNSDLISQVEKEKVLNRIKNGEVDLLYLSPETLLSYSIETIIGDREIGLLIVDEAHIVTSWGMGFRPDYWYLGGYINRLRNQIQTAAGIKRNIYHFPICAFTATAINGGQDDSVSDTIISLYMENPIKYIGYVRRDDIKFEIAHKSDTKLPKSEYEEAKAKNLSVQFRKWLKEEKKAIVYFPYASYAYDAYRGVKSFAGIKTDKRIGGYTGKNVEGLNVEAFKESKNATFEQFRSGKTPIMLATKAFGMGVDVDDVDIVYHYAISGNLCDYVQEIGRAARKTNMTGVATMDYYYNDLSFMNTLFGMSQIKQYQIKKVLEGIYDTYKTKKEARSFLITPESFTYIFNGKGVRDESECINKLKTCLLMLEKDFYDKYNFKVIISRPQSVFTKAYVVIFKNDEKKVLNSKYGKCFKFISKGRDKEKQANGDVISDDGDIYSLDLKTIWEDYYPNISFPQFKYWYFNFSIPAKDKIDIMPTIRDCFAPRQKVNIEARHDLLLNEVRDKILEDFEYIADLLYKEYKNKYFTIEDFVKLIREKYGMNQARIIANSLFDLVDPKGRCVKYRTNDSSGKTEYYLSNGNFKEFMRRLILKSRVIGNINHIYNVSFSGYMSLMKDEKSNIALKLLSIFDYITYEIVGGEEPEIFIRLNDPNKIRSIALGNTYYTNDYVSRARQKHDRDVKVLLKFFKQLNSDDERWNYIENYFLGHDVLDEEDVENNSIIELKKAVDVEKSFQTSQFKKWEEIKKFMDTNVNIIIQKLEEANIKIPEYLETAIKHSNIGENIIMSWPTKNLIICQQDTDNSIMSEYLARGWHAYRLNEIDLKRIKSELQ